MVLHGFTVTVVEGVLVVLVVVVVVVIFVSMDTFILMFIVGGRPPIGVLAPG